jgi:ribose 5-phosphate isomerase B
MKIAVGGDHCGYNLKTLIIPKLEALGHEVVNYGCFSPEPVDFPDIAKLICDSVLNGDAERGIMFCGTGVGASIACNKVSGIRASVCHDVHSAHQCVEHDDVQIMCIGEQIIGHVVALELIQLFLKAEFSIDEACRRRVHKLNIMDNSAE